MADPSSSAPAFRRCNDEPMSEADSDVVLDESSSSVFEEFDEDVEDVEEEEELVEDDRLLFRLVS